VESGDEQISKIREYPILQIEKGVKVSFFLLKTVKTSISHGLHESGKSTISCWPVNIMHNM